MKRRLTYGMSRDDLSFKVEGLGQDVDPKEAEQLQWQLLKELPEEDTVTLKLRFVKMNDAGRYRIDEDSERALVRVLNDHLIDLTCGYQSLGFEKEIRRIFREIDSPMRGLLFRDFPRKGRPDNTEEFRKATSPTVERKVLAFYKKKQQESQDDEYADTQTSANENQRETVLAILKEAMTSPEFAQAVMAATAQQQPDTDDIVAKIMAKMSGMQVDEQPVQQEEQQPSEKQQRGRGGSGKNYHQTSADVYQEKLQTFLNSREFMDVITDVTEHIAQSKISDQVDALAASLVKQFK